MKKAKKEAGFKTLSFLSDFGYEDEFVGVVKSVVYEMAPFSRIVDITHGIPAHNIRAGSLALARCGAYLSPGVVLAVVDPGVGSSRRAVAVEVGGGSSVLVAPDNGILAPVTAMVGGPDRVFEITNSKYQLPQPEPLQVGKTFAARDIFAPAVAHIMNGLDISELGDEVDPNSLTPQILPVARKKDDGSLAADVLWIDKFGNVQLNLEEKDLAELGTSIQLFFKDMVRTLSIVKTYADLGHDSGLGEFGIVIDSYGLAAIVGAKTSAAFHLGMAEGDEVMLAPIKEIPVEPR